MIKCVAKQCNVIPLKYESAMMCLLFLLKPPFSFSIPGDFKAPVILYLPVSVYGIRFDSFVYLQASWSCVNSKPLFIEHFLSFRHGLNSCEFLKDL